MAIGIIIRTFLISILALALMLFAISAQARFLQTDPIGYGDGLNWHAYVGNDPMNRADPFGLAGCSDNLSKAKCSSALKAQKKAIKKLGKALKKLQKLAGNLKDGKSGGSAAKAFEKAFGKGSATEENVNKVIGMTDNALTVLKDDGSTYNYAEPAAKYAKGAGQMFVMFNKKTGKPADNNIYVRNHFRKLDSQGRQQSVIHEPIHHMGYRDYRFSNNSRAYLGNGGARKLANTNSTAALGNPDNFAAYIMGLALPR